MTNNVANLIGPLTAGALVGAGAGNVMVGGLVLAGLVSALWALRLARHLPAAANRI